MAQAVSRRPLTAEAWVRSRVGPCGICGGQSGIETGLYFHGSDKPEVMLWETTCYLLAGYAYRIYETVVGRMKPI
jgi:hypothetical protein